MTKQIKDTYIIPSMCNAPSPSKKCLTSHAKWKKVETGLYFGAMGLGGTANPHTEAFTKPYNLILYFHGDGGSGGAIKAGIKEPLKVIAGENDSTILFLGPNGRKTLGGSSNNLWFPNKTFIPDTLNAIADDLSLTGVNRQKVHDNARIHLYGFSAGGKSMSYFINSNPDYLNKVVHLQFNDAIWSWRTQATNAILNAWQSTGSAHKATGEMTTTVWYSKDPHSVNYKAAMAMMVDPVIKALTSGGHFSAHKMTGGHGSAIPKIDKASFADNVVPPTAAEAASPTVAATEALANIKPDERIFSTVTRIPNLPAIQQSLHTNVFKTLEVFELVDFPHLNHLVSYKTAGPQAEEPVIFFGALGWLEEEKKWFCRIHTEAGTWRTDAGVVGAGFFVDNDLITDSAEDLANIANEAAGKIGIVKDPDITLDGMADFSPGIEFRKLWQSPLPPDLNQPVPERKVIRFILLTTRQEITNKALPSVAFGDGGVIGDRETTTANIVPTSPDSGNFANTSTSGKKVVVMKLGDIPLYQMLIKRILVNLDSKITEYRVTFDKPFNPLYYVEFLQKLLLQIKEILTETNITYDPERKIRFEFSDDFKELLTMFIVSTPDNPSQQLQSNSRFVNQTYNALIWNMPKIYNRYAVSYQTGGTIGNIFLSGDDVKTFVNRYIVPIPEINMASLTSGLIERFVLGDTRLLNDEYYDSYFVRPEHMGATLKHNLDIEISQQYEQIGDFLGNKWIQGDFKDIKNVDDLYDQLLEHIKMEDVIKLSAQCLLKLIPADEWLDYICKPVLEKYDEYQAAIIQELESMDDGVAKNLAKELHIFGQQQLDEGLDWALNKSISVISTGINMIKNAVDASTWSSKDSLLLFIKDIYEKVGKLVSMYAYGESSVGAQLQAIAKEIEDVKSSQTELYKQLEIFRGNPPAVHAETLEYYSTQIYRLEGRQADLNKLAKNIVDQLRQYNFLVPIDVMSIPTPTSGLRTSNAQDALELHIADAQLKILDDILHKDEIKDNFNYALPHMVVLDPYITDSDKESIYQFFYNQMSDLNEEDANWAVDTISAAEILSLKFNAFYGTGIADGAIKTLYNQLSYEEIGFTFKQGEYGLGGPSEQAKDKTTFKANLYNISKMLKNIQMLNDLPEDSPADIANKLKNFGEDTAEKYLDLLFEDPLKRRKLCLAIYSAGIGGTAYLVHMLITDPKAVGDWFVDQGAAIYKGFSRKLEIFTNINYPVQDILESLGATLIKVGKNLGRDILINGIMMILDTMRLVCADDEKVNAPYSPTGAVDLSSFMVNSKKGANGTKPASSANTQTMMLMINMSAGITASQFETILTTLSSAFTISETCRLLNGKAPRSLYTKAIGVLKELKFLKNTRFNDLYLNEPGMKNLYKSLSKDIEPAFCAQAMENFEMEKGMLLEICFSRDDTALRDIICRDKTPEECLDLMSSRAALPGELLRALSDMMPSIMEPITPADPCEDGDGIFDDSQKYTTEKIGNAIFGSLEKSLESDLSRIKSIYLDNNSRDEEALLNTGAGGGNAMKKFERLSKTPDYALTPLELEDKIKMKQNLDNKNKPFAAKKIIQNIKKMRDEIKFISWTPDPDSPAQIHAYSGQSQDPNLLSGKSVKFLFDPLLEPMNTELSVFDESTDSAAAEQVDSEDAEDGVAEAGKRTAVATYSANRFEYITDMEDRSPENVLFDPAKQGLAISQPNYDQSLKNAIGGWAMEEDLYVDIINGILKDLISSSAYENQEGANLFKKSDFNRLLLNKKFSVSDCFLGFMNKDVLNIQLQNLSQKLTCYNTSSATETAVNVAMAKMAVDVLIRIIAVKELMKSLFVYGIFPSELKPDNEQSFYDQLVNREISKALAKHMSSSGKDINGFYDDVVKTFIHDTMKILYQEEELTPQRSFDLIKNSQFGFVKKQFIRSLQLVPQLQDKAKNQLQTEYSMTKYSTEATAAEVYLDHDSITYTDKLEALVSSGFTNFLNKSDSASRTSPIEDTVQKSIKTKVFFPTTAPNDLPIFDRRHTSPLDYLVNYFNFDHLRTYKTQDLRQILKHSSGEKNGIALECMVELDYKSVNLNESQLRSLREFFEALDLLIHSHFLKNKSESYDYIRRLIRNMLYETKLILFIPQMKSFLDRMAAPKDPADEPYYNIVTTIVVTEVDGQEVETETTTYSLDTKYKLAHMFEYNFNPTWTGGKFITLPGLDWQYGNKMFVEDFETLITDMHKYGSAWLGKHPDTILNGEWLTKDYYARKEQLRDKYFDMSNTVGPAKTWDGKLANTMELFQYIFGDSGTPLSSWHPGFGWGGSDTTGGVSSFAGVKSVLLDEAYFKWDDNNDVPLDSNSLFGLKALYGFARLYFPENIQKQLPWYDNQKADKLSMNPESPSWHAEDEYWNFFQSLIGAEVNEILPINTVFRLNTYNKSSEDLRDSFNAAVLDSYPDNPERAKKELIKEKIGTHRFGYGSSNKKSDPSDSLAGFDFVEPLGIDLGLPDTETFWHEDYITFPLFEYVYNVPSNLTWFDFFMDIGAEANMTPFRRWSVDTGYQANLTKIINDYYTPTDDHPNLNWKLNDILFLGTQFSTKFLEWLGPVPETIMPVKNTVDGPVRNVNYYLDRLKFGATTNKIKDKFEYVEEYASCHWFNIRNCPVPEDAILAHVAKSISTGKANAGPIPGWAPQAYSKHDHDIFQGNHCDPVNTPATKDFTDTGNSLIYLTDDSYASLTENHEYFISKGTFSQGEWNWWNPDDTHPDGTVGTVNDDDAHWGTNYDSVTQEYDAYGQPVVKWHKSGYSPPVVVGTFDLTDANGKVLQKDFKKWIRIRLRTDAGLKIDYGWSLLSGGDGGTSKQSDQKTKNKATQNKYPGANIFQTAMHYGSSANFGKQGSGLSHDRLRPIGRTGYSADAHATSWCYLDLYAKNVTVAYGPLFTGLANTEKVVKKVEVPQDTVPIDAYKMFANLLTNDEIAADIFKLLLQTFFLKEQSNMIAILHKAFVEQHYPDIETNFDGTINMAIEILATAIATLRGDYQHNSPSNKPGVTNRFAGFADINIKEVAKMLGKAVVYAFANTADPTWKTEWFLPGPLTPFGVAAKLMDEDWSDDDDSPSSDFVSQDTECIEKQSDAQIEYFSNYTKNNKKT